MRHSSTTTRSFAPTSFLTIAAALASLAAAPTVASAQVATDPASLTAALAGAAAGDVVEVSGTIIGDFMVPAGVTLRGVGAAVIQGAGAGAALIVVPGATATAVEDLLVVSDGRYGIWVSGAGASQLTNLTVTATRGVGIAAEGTDSLALTDVELWGPVTEASAASVPALPSPHDTATHGLILLGVDDGALDGVTASGFAEAGAIIASSTTALWNSRFDRNVGTGLVIAAGDTTLDNVRAGHTYRGARGDHERVAGIAIGAGANIETDRVRTTANEGFGVFHDESGISDHENMTAIGNRDGGIWAQGAEYLGLHHARVTANYSTGVAAIDTTYTAISDTSVGATHLASVGGRTALADGIQLIDTPGALENVDLRASSRVGLLVDDTSSEDVTISNLVVAGSRWALGVIFQNGSILEPVTEGVIRLGRVRFTDELATGLKGMEIVEQWEPPGGLPRAQDLVEQWEPPGGLPPESGIDRIFGGTKTPLLTDGRF